MKISLNNFETAISSVIVSRGEEYFNDEAVRGLKQIKDGEWGASVEGTETYKVRVVLSGSNVSDYSCTCPYDMGPVCKHVVAVLFAMREAQEELPKSSKRSGSSQKKSNKAPEETFEDIVARLPREDLNAILLDYAGQDTDFVDFVFARSTLRKPSSDKDQYQTIIRTAVDAVRGRHGYIGYWEASKAVRGADMVFDKAREFLDKKSPEKALPIYQAVLEQMVPLLQEADDSNSEIGGVIETAFEGLFECGKLAKDPAFKKTLFTYLLNEAMHSRYDGWSSWRWHLLTIAGNMVTSPDEQKRLFAQIDAIKDKETRGRDQVLFQYDAERATVIKFEVIERIGTKKEAEAFLSDHLDCSPLREWAIDRALKHKDFTQAKKLALDALNPDLSRGLPGVILRWKQKLLEIAEAERDRESIKKYSLEIFLEGGNFEHYERYKKCFTSTQWPDEAQNIIDAIRNGKDNRNKYLLLPDIYIREAHWQDLFDHVKKEASAGSLEQYAKHLEPHFPAELADIYEKVIVEKLAPLMGRSHYQYLCRFLRRMQKLAGKDRVQRLAAQLSEKYNNRPAMLEELRQV